MSIRQHDFTLERRFRQTPEQTFQAFADPTLKQRWFGVLADGLGAGGGLVDADRPDDAVSLVQDVAADPADVAAGLGVERSRSRATRAGGVRHADVDREGPELAPACWRSTFVGGDGTSRRRPRCRDRVGASLLAAPSSPFDRSLVADSDASLADRRAPNL
ncbi:hypothetical protein [Baekduia alba]|uniref:hypothetical protein n=1 Tax=Baekduia alba TaxID=2997333 RepID=UPI002340B2B2|nr:hypothetical protein [Baekduia alba]